MPDTAPIPDAPAPDEAPALHQEHSPDGASGNTLPDEAQASLQPARQCATKKSLEDHSGILGEGSAQGVQWAALCRKHQEAIGAKAVERLADLWGVSPQALQRLGIGFDAGAYTFPMRNARGEIIGIRKRAYKDPTQKFAVEGSANGLFIPTARTSSLKSSRCLQASSWQRAGALSDGAPARAQGVFGLRAGGVEIITESESDLAAALTRGVPGIGRAGAYAPTAEVVAFFQGCLTACPCIVADADANAAGQEGAEVLAEALVAAGVPCRVLLPPDGIKDLRDWFTRGGLTAAALRAAIHRQLIRWPDEDSPGFVQIPNRLLRRGLIAKIKAGPFALACLIQGHYSPGGKMYPPREALARVLGVTAGTVDRYKRILADAGLIEWQRGGTSRANVYERVNFGPVRKTRRSSAGL